MHLFSGQLTVLVQSGTESGDIHVEVSAKGVKKAPGLCPDGPEGLYVRRSLPFPGVVLREYEDTVKVCLS